MTLHADNAGPHVAKCVTGYMNHNSLKRAPHSPDLPDLALSDFYLFGYIKHQLQGHEFTKGVETCFGYFRNVESHSGRYIR
jgi:hypothetical protein